MEPQQPAGPAPATQPGADPGGICARCPICGKGFTSSQGMGGHYGRCRAQHEQRGGIPPSTSERHHMVGAPAAAESARRQFVADLLANPPARAANRIFGFKPNPNARKVPQSRVPTELPASHLVPIRLNITCDGRQLKDCFLWDVLESSLSPEEFGKLLCYDLELPLPFESLIAQSVHEHLANYCMHHLRLPHEYRITIKLDLRLGGYCLRDQFEWDMTEPANDPELFARALCAELGLSQEFVVAVAHSIREQLNDQCVTLINAQRMPNVQTPITPRTAVRSARDVDLWCPEVDELDPTEVARLEKSSARHERVRRRENNGTVAAMLLPGMPVAEPEDDRPRKMRNPYGRAGKPEKAKQLEEQISTLEHMKRRQTGAELGATNREIEECKQQLEEIKAGYLRERASAPGKDQFKWSHIVF
eukprot:TRINITY_DN49364_c0_g1_i1.p1 TRINITY_DN49364_c0_g1~~TRINITY_DN49364_c0_g1_i1.p1  ORF type:complete len:420 (-),score=76.30 TRINITY_DN49364_c0_g1_i1:546-1805(-)